MVDRWNGALDIPWAERGDEWIEHVWEALATKVQSLGRAAGVGAPNSKIPWRHHIYELNYSVLRSQLVLAEEKPTKFRVLITGDGEQTPDQVAPWIYAVKEARRRTGKSDKMWVWLAYAGVKPSPKSFDARLPRPVRLGDEVRVLPDDKMTLLTPATRAGLSAVRIHPTTVHAVVTRVSAGIWPDGQRKSAVLLERACQLISVVIDEPFVVLDDGQAQEKSSIDDVEPTFPEPTRRDSELLSMVGHVDNVLNINDSELSVAWRLLHGDEALRHAISAHHQGLRMMDEHQSYAAIAFVSVLESLGEDDHDLARCASCGQLTGLGSRFRRSVEQIYGDAGAQFLANIYSRRSKTAHEGVLHGLELLPEGYQGRYLSEDHEFYFYRQLHVLRAASTQLLRSRLGIAHGTPL